MEELNTQKQPNTLLKEIASKNKFITPITPKDFTLFESFFANERPTYGNSWTYITQGMHGIGKNNLGYKYYDGKNLAAISIHQKIEQPEIFAFYWVRPMGPTVLDKITEISKQLNGAYKLPIYVKKIFKDQHDQLIEKGFQEVDKFPWHSTAPAEDDTYPEVIIDTRKIFLNKSRNLSNASKKYKSLASLLECKEVITDNDHDMAWRVVENFFKQSLPNLTNNISNKNDYYNIVFDRTNSHHKTYLLLQQGNPIAVFDSHESLNFISSYAALALRMQIKNLNDFIVFSLSNKYQGKFINLGGSETQGLHEFKTKFVVSELLQMYWVTMY